MTVEADFTAEGSYEFRINLDPRVFLSRNPAALAPLDAPWLLEQSDEQRQHTFQQGETLLNQQLRLMLGGQLKPWPKMDWRPLDGATGTLMHEETEEVHLLATLRGQVPAGVGDFALEYAKEAQVSLILLIRTPDAPDPRVQVMFPGERSRPVPVRSKVNPPPMPISAEIARQTMNPIQRWGGWAALGLSIIGLLLGLRCKTKR